MVKTRMKIPAMRPLPLSYPLQRDSYKKAVMSSGSWDHSQTLEQSGALILAVPSMHMLLNNGVCLFQYYNRSYSNPLPTELADGSKRVAWKSIKENNSWYISKTFLLNKQTFENPTRLQENHLHAYWKHWLR